MRTWAIVDKTTKIIHNVVVWDGVSPYDPKIPNVEFIECTGFIAEPGGMYENGEFIRIEEVQRRFAPPPSASETIENEVTSEPTVI